MLRSEFTALHLPANDRIEAGVLAHQSRWQPQQFASPMVDHRNAPIRTHHDDALAHVLERGGQCVLIGGQAATVAAQQDADTQHKGRQADTGHDVLKTMQPVGGEHLVRAVADRHNQLVVGKATIADDRRVFGHHRGFHLVAAVIARRRSFGQSQLGERAAEQSRLPAGRHAGSHPALPA